MHHFSLVSHVQCMPSQNRKKQDMKCVCVFVEYGMLKQSAIVEIG